MQVKLFIVCFFKLDMNMEPFHCQGNGWARLNTFGVYSHHIITRFKHAISDSQRSILYCCKRISYIYASLTSRVFMRSWSPSVLYTTHSHATLSGSEAWSLSCLCGLIEESWIPRSINVMRVKYLLSYFCISLQL